MTRSRGRRADPVDMSATVPRETAAAAAEENLRSATREARETLKDIRAAITELRRLQDDAMRERVERQVSEILDRLAKATRVATDDAADRAVDQFDRLFREHGLMAIQHVYDARDQVLGSIGTAMTQAMRIPGAPKFELRFQTHRPATFDSPGMVSLTDDEGELKR